eukprot:1094279-Pelagomonas_calceolata.AAC.4
MDKHSPAQHSKARHAAPTFHHQPQLCLVLALAGTRTLPGASQDELQHRMLGGVGGEVFSAHFPP